MREILFRGQTRRYGEKVRIGDGAKVPSNWVYGGILKGKGAHSVIYGGKNKENPGEGFAKWPVYSDTVGQFTGKTDRNGKKIFEGDIVKNGDYTMVVVWYDFHAAFMMAFRVDGDYYEAISNSNIYLEVIGNIHDNPELLEVP